MNAASHVQVHTSHFGEGVNFVWSPSTAEHNMRPIISSIRCVKEVKGDLMVRCPPVVHSPYIYGSTRLTRCKCNHDPYGPVDDLQTLSSSTPPKWEKKGVDRLLGKKSLFTVEKIWLFFLLRCFHGERDVWYQCCLISVWMCAILYGVPSHDG